MSSDPETIRVYDARAADYADLISNTTAQDLRLTAFIAALPPGGHALDLGCGPGTASALMAKAGLRVTAVDASREMIALAGRHPGVNTRQASFDDITGSDLYDGIWASFSLLHAPRNAMPRHLAALKQALKPGGSFVIALKSGKGEHRDSIGRHYTYYEEETLTALLRQHGFAPGTITRGRDIGLSGEPADWFSVFARG